MRETGFCGTQEREKERARKERKKSPPPSTSPPPPPPPPPPTPPRGNLSLIDRKFLCASTCEIFQRCPRLIHHGDHRSDTNRCFLIHTRYRSDARMTKRRDTFGMHEQQWRDEARWASHVEKRDGSMIEELRLNHCDDERCSRFGTQRRLSRVRDLPPMCKRRKSRTVSISSHVILRVAMALYGELAREYVATRSDVITWVNKRHECRMKPIAMLDASINIFGGVSVVSVLVQSAHEDTLSRAALALGCGGASQFNRFDIRLELS
ncbi:hypothetical protein ALC60_09980 [Trachymyrmex zeteki]|uniref:Uncharacterized protein n=1 Tax=Mycetomoellerius zeteki TaxID=64791 RepID=A0A151WSR9_9HYME|nr:hypothetical protein ALC60_09980 [Trachymyrmex zeteki]